MKCALTFWLPGHSLVWATCHQGAGLFSCFLKQKITRYFENKTTAQDNYRWTELFIEDFKIIVCKDVSNAVLASCVHREQKYLVHLECNNTEDNTTWGSGWLMVFFCRCIKMSLSRIVNLKLLLTGRGWHDRSAANSVCEQVHVQQSVQCLVLHGWIALYSPFEHSWDWWECR